MGPIHGHAAAVRIAGEALLHIDRDARRVHGVIALGQFAESHPHVGVKAAAEILIGQADEDDRLRVLAADNVDRLLHFTLHQRHRVTIGVVVGAEQNGDDVGWVRVGIHPAGKLGVHLVYPPAPVPFVITIHRVAVVRRIVHDVTAVGPIHRADEIEPARVAGINHALPQRKAVGPLGAVTFTLSDGIPDEADTVVVRGDAARIVGEFQGEIIRRAHRIHGRPDIPGVVAELHSTHPGPHRVALDSVNVPRRCDVLHAGVVGMGEGAVRFVE